jgi:hypothetical protein
VIAGLLVALTDLPWSASRSIGCWATWIPHRPKASNVGAIRAKYPVLDEYDRGRTINDLAGLRGRQPGGVRSRLAHLGRLDDNPSAVSDR